MVADGEMVSASNNAIRPNPALEQFHHTLGALIDLIGPFDLTKCLLVLWLLDEISAFHPH